MSVDEPALRLVDQQPSPEIVTSRAISREEIAAAIAELPPELRDTLVLREVSDCSYREIAAITSVPMGTVMSRLARARARVATRLRPKLELEDLA